MRKVRFLKKLSLISFHSNFAIINECQHSTINILLYHLYTLFVIIRGFASQAYRTLDWTRTLAFWAVSGFWLTKTPLIGHCVIEINRYVSDLLQCTTLQKQSANTNTHLILTWGGWRLLSFCCLCLFSCFFPESWTWLHTFSLNHPGDPFFKARDPPEGRDPGFGNHCFKITNAHNAYDTEHHFNKDKTALRRYYQKRTTYGLHCVQKCPKTQETTSGKTANVFFCAAFTSASALCLYFLFLSKSFLFSLSPFQYAGEVETQMDLSQIWLPPLCCV